MCKLKAEACHSNSTRRLITLIITRANVSISRRPVNATQQSLEHVDGHPPFLLYFDMRWQSQSTLKHYRTQNNTVPLSKGCSFGFKIMLKQLCSVEVLLAIMKNMPNNSISCCGPTLYMSEGCSLTDSSTRKQHHKICQGHLSRKDI